MSTKSFDIGSGGFAARNIERPLRVSVASGAKASVTVPEGAGDVRVQSLGSALCVEGVDRDHHRSPGDVQFEIIDPAMDDAPIEVLLPSGTRQTFRQCFDIGTTGVDGPVDAVVGPVATFFARGLKGKSSLVVAGSERVQLFGVLQELKIRASASAYVVIGGILDTLDVEVDLAAQVFFQGNLERAALTAINDGRIDVSGMVKSIDVDPRTTPGSVTCGGVAVEPAPAQLEW